MSRDMGGVHFIWPHDIDDPLRPSGGDRYDRELATGLAGRGWTVHEHIVEGAWPATDTAGCAGLAVLLDALPDDARVVLDGLIGSAVADVLESRAGRLRLVLLVHLPTGGVSEGAVARLVDRVVTTSEWSRRWLHDHYGIEAQRIQVATPGVTPSRVAPHRPDGGALLCVGAVTPVKGHDILVEALGMVDDLPWTCRIVGSAEVDPRFARGVRDRAIELGLSARISWEGAVAPSRMDDVYMRADQVVVPSRLETYGMAIVEAFAHGLPVIGAAVGGVPEAFDAPSAGRPPGVLVEAERPAALAAALRGWLTDPHLRAQLRAGARQRRERLPSWARTVDVVESVLRRMCDRAVVT